MKKLILLITIITLSGIGVALVYFAPFHYYTVALTEGLETTLLTVRPEEEKYYTGDSYDVNFENLNEADSRLWQNFQFKHFIVPVPVWHPVYLLKPDIKQVSSDNYHFGFSFINQRNNVFSKVRVLDPIRFDFELGHDKLFNLPYFKNMILQTPPDKVWRDLFTKDLIIRPDDKNFYKNIGKLNEKSVRDLVYNLFILRNRQRLFDLDFERLQFFEDKNIGVTSIETSREDDQFNSDIFYIYRRGVIYPVELQTLKHSDEALRYRERFLNELKYESNSADSSIPIYTQYRQLDYQSRTGHEGLIFLYMAWSHVIDQQSFLREMIRFIERSEYKDMFVGPLYDYAFDNFGTNFSTLDRLEETDQVRFERLRREELQKEIEREAAKDIYIPESRFDSNLDRMDYFLQRAREQELEMIENDNTLIMD